MRAFLLLFCGLWLLPGMYGTAQTIQVDQISISGNRVTRDAIILRELSVRTGDTFPADSAAAVVEKNLLRLKNLALFTEVNLQWDTLTQQQWALRVRVRERWYIWPEARLKLADRNFNVWWEEYNHDLRRINGSLALTHQNFRGNLEQLSAGVQFGYTQGFSLSYQVPYINRKQTRGLGFNLAYSRNQEFPFAVDSNKLRFVRSRETYLLEQLEVAAHYIYRPAYHATHQVTLSYYAAQIADTVLTLTRDYFPGQGRRFRGLELSYRLALNYVDNWSYPTRGKKLVNYLGWRQGTAPGTEWQLYLDPEAGLFLRPWPRLLTSHIFRGHFSLPAQSSFAWNTGMGYGPEYVRGLEHFVTEGPHYAIGRSSLKYELLNKTFPQLPFRYLPNLPVAIYPKVFADVGYAYQAAVTNRSFLSNQLLYSAGAGVDIVTAYDLKFRIEYVRNSLGQWGWFFHMDGE